MSTFDVHHEVPAAACRQDDKPGFYPFTRSYTVNHLETLLRVC
ncbi:hypothetical protein ACFTRD_22145 [Paenibacillus sp. NPDC056933]|nr:hypothetical protein [Paenibacillus sp. JNUCC-31]